MDIPSIRYSDLAVREREERKRLQNRLNQIDRTAKSRLGGGGGSDMIYLSDDERIERERIIALQKVLKDHARYAWADPLFVAARDLFNDNFTQVNGRLGVPVGTLEGAMPSVQLRRHSRKDPSGTNPPDFDPYALSTRACAEYAMVLGMLVDTQAVPPPVEVDLSDLAKRTKPTPRRTTRTPAPASGNVNAETGSAAEGAEDDDDDADFFVINADRSHPDWIGFSRAFFAALGEAQAQSDLAVRVLEILGRIGSRSNGSSPEAVVDSAEFAKVMRRLARDGVTASSAQLSRRVDEALDEVQNRGRDDVVSELGIDLPDLEATAANEIVADNVRLMGPVICAAMMDELKAFQVVDRLVEMAQSGTLPIVGRGAAGELLYRRWREAPNRMSEQERQSLYAMTMGQPGGDPSGVINREFDDLWLRFVSSVSAFVRQSDVDKLIRANLPSAIGQQQVRKAARDLASNLSLHGYGMTYFAALELQKEVKSMIKLLGDAEIMGAFGAKDMWQVIDQVATLELGGARTSARYRTLATCGAIITAWLANNVHRIMRAVGPLIDLVEVRAPVPRTGGKTATSNPTDYDLVNACELWLADTATADLRVEEMAQPRETPAMTSKPVQIPAFAREFLDDLPPMPGLELGAGRGAANGRQRQWH